LRRTFAHYFLPIVRDHIRAGLDKLLLRFSERIRKIAFDVKLARKLLFHENVTRVTRLSNDNHSANLETGLEDKLKRRWTMKAVAARNRIELKNILYATDFSPAAGGVEMDIHRGGASMPCQVRVIRMKKSRIMRPDAPMKTPYGLQVIESCLTCPLVKERVFCDLPRSVMAAFDAVSASATYPKGAILFVEGQEARGVFVLCHGRVKLSTNSADGKSIIVRISEPGELVGLPGTLSGKPYELTAEALEPLQANFIPRGAFLQFLREHGEAAVRVAEILSKIYYATLLEVRYLGFSNSAAEKLARFLLDLPTTATQTNEHLRATLTLTHKEIGETIGASRETVTRLFAHFKREGLIEVHGSTLLIADKPNLEKLVAG
jgi:CRP/FNR family transcriptional regulator